LDHTTIYPGIQEALAAIQHSGNGMPRKMAILSNKPVSPSRAIVESLGLGRYFSQIYGGNSFSTKKPEPEGALKLVSEAGVRPEEAAIVGDSHVDIRTGRNAGLWTVAVTYGFAPHTLEEEVPDVMVDAPQELSTIFLSQRSLQEQK
jgi:phosphoglycolate phosphatase